MKISLDTHLILRQYLHACIRAFVQEREDD